MIVQWRPLLSSIPISSPKTLFTGFQNWAALVCCAASWKFTKFVSNSVVTSRAPIRHNRTWYSPSVLSKICPSFASASWNSAMFPSASHCNHLQVPWLFVNGAKTISDFTFWACHYVARRTTRCSREVTSGTSHLVSKMTIWMSATPLIWVSLESGCNMFCSCQPGSSSPLRTVWIQLYACVAL